MHNRPCRLTDANEAAVGSRENSGVTRASYLGTRPDGRWVAGRLALKGRGRGGRVLGPPFHLTLYARWLGRSSL